ncbi:MAG: hypothetical protein ACTSY1_01235 [Alphaproteobacteria bacterium]
MNGWFRVFRYRLGILSEVPMFAHDHQSVFRAFSSSLSQSLVAPPARRRTPKQRINNKRKAIKSCTQS